MRWACHIRDAISPTWYVRFLNLSHHCKYMYTLIIEDRHGRNAAEISFEQGSYNIGRMEGNDVVLPSSSVSRTHARIFVSNNKCYFDDLGSTGGSFINGAQVTQRTEIMHGTKIKIGDYTLYLEYRNKANISQGQEFLKTQIVSGVQGGYKIVRVGDKFAGEEFMLSEPLNTIGRAEDNYILLSDPSVSRNHAQIANLGITFKLVDLNSQNGTFVGGKRIEHEQILQSGDEIGFGNLRFVFIPSAQNVNLAMYAKSSNESRSVILMLAILLIVFVVVLAIVAVFAFKVNNDEVQTDPSISVQEDTFDKLNELYTSAFQDCQAGRLKSANEKLSVLLEKWPNEARVKELQIKVDEEMRNEEIIAKGDEFYDHDLFSEALDQYSQVSENSMAYRRVRDRIEDATRKLFVVAYNEARAACETELTEDCLRELCDASLALKEDGKHEAILVDAIQFLEKIPKNKKNVRFASSAKKCLSSLK